jgi:poly-gamma-glutamate synthesis protein (capsule biosynthesis protein)
MRKAIITILGILTGISLVLLGYMLLMYHYSQEADLGYPVPEKSTQNREIRSPYEAPDFEGTQEQQEEETEEEIQLSFVGDLNLNGFEALYSQGGIRSLLSQDCVTELTSADYTMGNHEFAFSTRGEAQEKEYVFREDPGLVTALTDMGMDLVSLANNHALDYGQDALMDTMDTLQGAGIGYVGAGADDTEARALKTAEIKGKTIGFLAASRVIPSADWNAGQDKPGMFTCYDTSGLLASIQEAKKSCDLVVVYLHWGTERVEYPEEYERQLGKDCIDAGADLVLGSHPHILQGFEFYQGKAICYSLGNFLFAKTTDTMVLQAIVSRDNTITLRISPYEREGNCLVKLQDSASFFSHLQDISFNAVIDEQGYIKETENE